MPTVPAHIADVALGDADPAVRARVAGCAVTVGAAVEIDLDRLAAVDPDTAADLTRYQTTVARFATNPTGPYLAVSRRIVDVRQTDNASGRADLTDELDGFADLPGVADVIAAVTASTFDPATIVRLGAPFAATVTTDGPVTTVTLTVTGRHAWPVALGGAQTATEVARNITVTVSHAPWRDRRSRRLTAVTVEIVELLPDPTHP